MMPIWKRLKQMMALPKSSENRGTPALSAPSAARLRPLSDQPDSPTPFGYKTSWLALPTTDPQAVAQALDLRDLTYANWQSGFARAGQSDARGGVWVFVTPAQGDWVLVNTGLGLAAESPETAQILSDLVARLSQKFGRCQYFGTYRVVEYVAWILAERGTLRRGFSCVDGQLFLNTGTADADEQDVTGLDLTGLDEAGMWEAFEAQESFLDEDWPITLAGRLGLSPHDIVPDGASVGWAGRLPDG